MIECEELFVLVFIDLDGFKIVNDLVGYDFGDNCFVVVVNILKEVYIGDVEVICWGGDEFLIVIFGEDE